MDIKAALELLEGYPHEYGSEPYGHEGSMGGDVQICIRSEYLPTGRIVDTLSMDETPYDRKNLNARGGESKRQFAIYLHEYCLDNTEKTNFSVTTNHWKKRLSRQSSY